MENLQLQIDALRQRNEDLEALLFEATSLIEAIREGSVDALVLSKDGKPFVYSIESADYTYRVLIEKFGEGALSISQEGLILYCNEYFSRLANLPATKITGTFFSSYVDSPADFARLKAALRDGPSKDEIVLNFDGRKVHVYVSLTDLQPNVEAIGVVVTDLSERRKHEEALVEYQNKLERKVNELHQTNTSLEQFIHVISHDIKEPLRKIVTFASHLLINRADTLEELERNNIKKINTSAQRLNSLVDDLVKYAASASKMDFDKVDLDNILRDVIEDLELLITESGATIKMPKLPQILCSNVQMRQLFANLLTNAIKYSREGVSPVIAIHAEIISGVEGLDQDKKFHKITLEDNGIGIDALHLNKIFTIFQRLHMRDEYSGNGIGLAICKKIMENHSGRIDAESIPGVGSTFNIYFPVTSE